MTETLLYFTYYGVMCVALTPNLLMAAVASNSLYLTMNLFSGFVIPAPVSPLPLPLPFYGIAVLLQLLMNVFLHLCCCHPARPQSTAPLLLVVLLILLTSPAAAALLLAACQAADEAAYLAVCCCCTLRL